MKGAWFIALLAGCGFHPGASPSRTPDAPGVDGARSVDAPPPDGPGATGDTGSDPTCGWGYMPTNFDPCMLAGSPADLHVATGPVTPLDPDHPGLPTTRVMQSDGSMIAVVHLKSLTVDDGGELAIAAAPDLAGVVLAVDGDATIDGIIRVAGTDDPASCGNTGGAPGANSGTADDGAGGGGGGAAAADGGDGGDGNGGAKGAKGAKGAHKDDPMLSPLHGGCPGGAGGLASGSSDTAAAGGAGGGALEISARGTVMNTGKIGAYGEGGTGAPDHSEGGGGGGAGGGILLEGVMVSTSGVLCADGGSGGEGGGASSKGYDGNAGACTGATAARTQVVSMTLGGDGGDGSYSGATTGGTGGAGTHFSISYPNGGGGGGGGGVGWIRLHAIGGSPTAGGVVTPTPNVH